MAQSLRTSLPGSDALGLSESNNSTLISASQCRNNAKVKHLLRPLLNLLRNLMDRFAHRISTLAHELLRAWMAPEKSPLCSKLLDILGNIDSVDCCPQRWSKLMCLLLVQSEHNGTMLALQNHSRQAHIGWTHLTVVMFVICTIPECAASWARQCTNKSEYDTVASFSNCTDFELSVRVLWAKIMEGDQQSGKLTFNVSFCFLS